MPDWPRYIYPVEQSRPLPDVARRKSVPANGDTEDAARGTPNLDANRIGLRLRGRNRRSLFHLEG
ncbi:EspF repeat-containing protein [Schlesneria sp. DSM 10557]|uniref:EspF repeat-containing protein n=1 Tax=Schlesneria sp. DSM 10557 TaxID=3044399 RepID=UPI0035A14582